MNKTREIIIMGFSALLLSAASFAETPNNMQVWLKNGERQTFEINQVDSVTFGETPIGDFKPLNEWTFLPESTEPSPLSFSDEQKAYVLTGNSFAKQTFSLICQSDKHKDGNVFYSPISLQIALGLCANGATDAGAEQIAQVFGFQGENAMDDMNEYFNSIILSLNSSIDSITFKVNNAMWPIMGAKVKEPFLNVAREQYYATVRHLDYVKAPKAAKDTIDHWAALMTNDCIKELSIVIDPLTTLVINNACYFKGGWNLKIEEALTKKDSFTTITGEKQIIDMMHTSEPYSYAQTDDYQMVELNYGHGTEENPRLSNRGMGTYSMVIVLPAEGKNLDETMASINWDNISMQRDLVDLGFPRFGIKSAISLKDEVSKMGINDIFSVYPFSTNTPSFINEIVQDTYIKVDEEGTEAAAVTSIVAAGEAMPMDPQEMTVNRPFGFVIREKTTGMLLFMGKVTKVEEVSKD